VFPRRAGIYETKKLLDFAIESNNPGFLQEVMADKEKDGLGSYVCLY